MQLIDLFFHYFNANELIKFLIDFTAIEWVFWKEPNFFTRFVYSMEIKLGKFDFIV